MSHARRTLGGGLALALTLVGGSPASGQETAQPASASEPGLPAPAPAPAPAGLDRLLKLPSGQDYGVERRGGLSRGEWRVRFSELRDALAKEQRGLTEAQKQLDETAEGRSNWQMAPIPGFEPSPDAPLDYQLRVRIRRHRSEIERLESRLSELEIEANLAGVPEEWRS